jgi:predicted NBD/HSP70 family sugar kinase/DNA-binding CsgD family transcriptional regulator
MHTATPDHPAAPHEAPASQQALGERNRSRILSELASFGAATQAELARKTGFSHATVSNAVAKLRAQGHVRTEPTTSSGRRATLVSLTAVNLSYAGVAIEPTAIHVALSRAGSDRTSEHEFPVAADSPTGLSDALANAQRFILDQCSGAGKLAGTVLAMSPTAGHTTRLPFPEIQRAAASLEEALKVPVGVFNWAAMAAYAQTNPGDPTTHLYIDLGTTVTAGLVIGGHPYTGTAGNAGQLGHMSVGNQGVLCRCGNRDCLDTVASTRSMLETMSSVRTEKVTLRRFAEIVNEGDVPALRVLENAAEALGRAAAAAAIIMNPSRITLGGPPAVVGPSLLMPFMRSFTRAASPGTAEGTEIALNPLGPGVAALGAARFAADQARTP